MKREKRKFKSVVAGNRLLRNSSRIKEMDDNCGAHEEMETVCSDRSPAPDSDSEDRQNVPYDEELTHKVMF